MAFPTFKTLYNDTVTQMGLVSGTGVQTYTEPKVKLAVNRVFNFLWNKTRWPHLWTWEQYTLDGTTGKISGTVSLVRRWEDIVDVRVGGQETPIPFPSANEHTVQTTSGNQPLYRTVLPWDDTLAESKFFQFWPLTATGPVDMLIGHRPDVFSKDYDKVPMDYDLMIDGCVWWMLKDDGSNPKSAVEAKEAFDITYQDLVARHGSGGIGHGAGRRNGNTVIIQS